MAVGEVRGTFEMNYVNPYDLSVLKDLYESLGGDNWYYPWNFSTDPCFSVWGDGEGSNGVMCNMQGRINEIFWTSENLVGELPASVFTLPGKMDADIEDLKIVLDIVL
jgi:hypothetical protein